MHKKDAKNLLERLGAFPALLFLVVGVVFLVIGVFALRSNNLKMLELREAVFAADEQNGDVESALRELREFVHSHMNTDLAAGGNAIKPPIQLEHHYERLVAAEKARVQNANANIYTDAQNYCERTNPSGFSGRGRVNCIEQYVDSNGVTERPITEDLYKFDFVSPSWSPDLAGWSLVIAFSAFTAFAALFATERWLNVQLRRHS